MEGLLHEIGLIYKLYNKHVYCVCGDTFLLFPLVRFCERSFVYRLEK